MELTAYLVTIPLLYSREMLCIATEYDGQFAEIFSTKELANFPVPVYGESAVTPACRESAKETLRTVAEDMGWIVIAKICTIEITEHPIETNHILKTTVLDIARAKYPEYFI